MDPIYEIHKVTQGELTELSCHATHCVKAHSTKLLENDNLYDIFTKFTDQKVAFICQWLNNFMLANQRNFELHASKYLASKVLSYENWLDSKSKGCKGDILALYGLCMLLSVHAIIHLKNGLVWTTLSELSDNHAKDLDKCELHLCYLGRGIFIELVKRQTPLQVLEDKKDVVKSLVIGEITQDEYQSFDKAISMGLGIGLKTGDCKSEHTKSTVSKKSEVSASAGCPEDLPKVEKELRIILTRCPLIQSLSQQVPLNTD